ncbi:GNAT family N-acetyltransferase [Desulfovibrio oxyclinae]|uniref:GNAT family N-acetyltransferase n=1 Tax=Desulfovibrio oxyclinae TaxID=63560 RepID=UPI000477DDC0|nr:GNAT family N-acetyltransferase [Desulfovibrio oxyclinae]
MNRLCFRLASIDDSERLCSLMKNSCRTNFNFPEQAIAGYAQLFETNNFTSFLERERAAVWVAVFDEMVCGFLLALPPEGGVSTVLWLLVDQSFQARGIGSMLFDQCVDFYKKHGVHKIKLTAPSEDAVAFYKRIGFQVEGFHPHHWWGKDFWSLGYNL